MKTIVTAVLMLLFFGTAHAEDKMLKAEVKTTSEPVTQPASQPVKTPVTASAGAKSSAVLVAHVCTNGSNTRRVELSGTSPCEVHYKKETEKPGHDEVLYTAKNDQKYCEIKAQAFVEKLAGMGWKCDKA